MFIFCFYQAEKWSSDVVRHGSNWFDGFSTFCVNEHGKVNLHVVDNMMPDDDMHYGEQRLGLMARFAIMLGLVPKPGHGSAFGFADTI